MTIKDKNLSPARRAVLRAGVEQGFGGQSGMSRYKNLAIVCGAAIVVCLVGLALHRFAGFSRVEASLTIACIMLGAGQIVNLFGRQEVPQFDNGRLRDDIAELSYSLEAVRRDTEALDGRLKIQEEYEGNENTVRNEQMISQMRVLERLVQQLAEGAAKPSAAPEPEAPYDVGPGPESDPMHGYQVPEDHHEYQDQRDGNYSGLSVVHDLDPQPQFDEQAEVALLDAVRSSLRDNRVDLYLQPIVTLPQRKTRYYEGLSRLRGVDGEILLPSAYLRAAENAGLMPEIDNLLLLRCIQVVRRMIERKRDIGVFCNISPHSLLDSRFFPQFIEYMHQNSDLSSTLHFEFAQSMVASFGPLEHESLGALRELGFTFSMDRVTWLDFAPEALAQLGFTFVKVESDMLLNRSKEAGAQIHGADLSEHLRRQGIELIVEKIEHEHAVVDLLDYDVKLAQGYLFATPRPVRGDILESVPQIMTGTG